LVKAMFSSTNEDDPFTIFPHSLHEESITLRDPVAPLPPASTQMPTPLQLICCRVRVKACWISIPVETLMKLCRLLARCHLMSDRSLTNSPHVSDAVLLVAEQNTDHATIECQITHEQARAAT
jgi:hypothetical protein